MSEYAATLRRIQYSLDEEYSSLETRIQEAQSQKIAMIKNVSGDAETKMTSFSTAMIQLANTADQIVSGDIDDFYVSYQFIVNNGLTTVRVALDGIVTYFSNTFVDDINYKEWVTPLMLTKG